LAFQSAPYCLRCRFICLLSEAAILHLRDLSEFWGALHSRIGETPARMRKRRPTGNRWMPFVRTQRSKRPAQNRSGATIRSNARRRQDVVVIPPVSFVAGGLIFFLLRGLRPADRQGNGSCDNRELQKSHIIELAQRERRCHLVSFPQSVADVGDSEVCIEAANSLQ
jgi:hypothetical protein